MSSGWLTDSCRNVAAERVSQHDHTLAGREGSEGLMDHMCHVVGVGCDAEGTTRTGAASTPQIKRYQRSLTVQGHGDGGPRLVASVDTMDRDQRGALARPYVEMERTIGPLDGVGSLRQRHGPILPSSSSGNTAALESRHGRRRTFLLLGPHERRRRR